jgi:predicted small secreted protein
MKKVRILLFLLLLAMLLSACAKGSDIEYGVQLIENGSFEQVNGHGLPEAWQVVSYVYDDMITVSDVRDGEAHIVSYGENDSRFVQYIPVEKNTVYRITALVKANTVSGGEYGAGVSVADTFIASRQVFYTQDTWDAVELYVDSRGQTQLGIELRLGFFGNDAMGEAWFGMFRL